MTIHTPFPVRKATPWLVSSRPTPLSGYTFPNGEPCDPGMSGPQCRDSSTRIFDAIAAGSMAAQDVLDPGARPYYGYGGQVCPPGLVYNPASYACQPGVTGTVTASGNGLIWILLAAGAALFFMSPGRGR